MTILIKKIKYFDVVSRGYNTANILIDGNEIAVIEDNDNLDADEILDGSDKYLFPGLIDSHIHFFQSAGLFTRPDGLDLRHIKSYEDEINDIKGSIPELFERYLATGITGVVDCGGPFWNFEVQQQAGTAKPAPNVEVAGPLVSTVSREKLDLGDPPIIRATSEDHARQLVRKCVEREPVFVKLWFIYQEDSFNEDSQIMEAAIDETHKLGYRAAVHATELETARRAVIFGADILVHSVFSEKVDDDFVDLMVQNDVIYIPTIMVRDGYRDVYRSRLYLRNYEQIWGDPHIIESFEKLAELDAEQIPESHRELRDEFDTEPEDSTEIVYYNLKQLHEAGVTIATGTDAGNVGTLHGPSLHIEMWHMVQAGLDPVDVFIASTKHGALVMDRDDLGEIKEGNQADLVIFNNDPLADIENTQSIYATIRAGQLYDPTDLISPFSPEDLVQDQVEAYNNRDIDKFLSYYHPHIRAYDFQSGQLLFEGKDEMRERYQKLFDDSPDLNAEIVNRISLGEMIIDHEQVSGHKGRTYIVSAIAYYEIKHQRITRVWFSR